MTDFQDLSVQIEQLSDTDESMQTELLSHYIDNGLDTGSVAHILEAFPLEQRVKLWRSLPLELHIETLTEMRADVRVSIINELSETELRLTLAKLDNLSLLEWEDSLPEDIISDALALISRDELELYDRANQFDDEEVGHWAEQKVFTLPFGISVARAKTLLDRYQYESPHYVYLINKAKQYRGIVLYADILSTEGTERLRSLIKEDAATVNAHASLAESVDLFEHTDVSELAVIDNDQTLIGCVDWQFAISVQRELYEAKLMAGTGINEDDDLFAPVKKSAKKRGLWLGINLITAIFASITIGLFENVIAQVVALAVLMPIVASMGGIAGSQTLTLMVRAMALNQITKGNRWIFLKNEISIGALNGVIWAIIIGSIAGVWYQSVLLGATISLAILVNIATAALFGVLIPILLDKFKLDPALAGSVILTTVTDVVGFFAFLGTASLVLL